MFMHGREPWLARPGGTMEDHLRQLRDPLAGCPHGCPADPAPIGGVAAAGYGTIPADAPATPSCVGDVVSLAGAGSGRGGGR